MVQIPCALNNLREALSMLSPTGIVNPERTRLGAWLLESGVDLETGPLIPGRQQACDRSHVG